MKNYDQARLAYAAYAKTTDNKNFQGNEMPEFDKLPQQIQDAWWAAANAVKIDVETKR